MTAQAEGPLFASIDSDQPQLSAIHMILNSRSFLFTAQCVCSSFSWVRLINNCDRTASHASSQIYEPEHSRLAEISKSRRSVLRRSHVAFQFAKRLLRGGGRGERAGPSVCNAKFLLVQLFQTANETIHRRSAFRNSTCV